MNPVESGFSCIDRPIAAAFAVGAQHADALIPITGRTDTPHHRYPTSQWEAADAAAFIAWWGNLLGPGLWRYKTLPLVVPSNHTAGKLRTHGPKHPSRAIRFFVFVSAFLL
ncbi:unnamed protein product [Mesocestoides corti]|uniref:DUF4913 domain-containing protein n=1 Tax=Mesocestoides corti TaxID=53468 RepID=A0A0R3U2M3_MESCO|nr:unnamed protein product [Mesocestoides corti]